MLESKNNFGIFATLPGYATVEIKIPWNATKLERRLALEQIDYLFRQFPEMVDLAEWPDDGKGNNSKDTMPTSRRPNKQVRSLAQHFRVRRGSYGH